MNYNEALEYIHGTYKFGSKLGLDNVSRLLELMGNPEKDLKVIHVAGTNGKGSTSSFISSILMEEGYKVGLYTSPFLEVFNERIRINGENIPNNKLGEITGFVKEQVEKMLEEGLNHPTEFEIVTAVAFEHYKREAVDFVVLEVGMGGRLDSTNVVERPLVSVITPIDLDHTDYLGDTLAKVAFEKAGIIKDNSVAVVHPQEHEVLDVIAKKCDETNTKLVLAPIGSIEILKGDEFGTTFKVFSHEYSISLLGEHQTRNATVAITAINALKENYEIKVSDESIESGLLKAIWPGRMEVMSRKPTVLIDGAHNFHGARGLSTAVRKLFPGRKIIAVVGILGDKDVSGILAEMMPLCHEVIATEPNNPRKMSAAELADKMSGYSKAATVEPNIKEAIDIALKRANTDDVVIFFGSLYMIGDVRGILRTINMM